MYETGTRGRVLRAIGVVGLVVGPLSLIVATVLQWTVEVPDRSSVLFAAVGATSVFGPMIWLLGIPAVVALTHERGWVLTLAGGLITGIGLAAAVGHLALFFGTAQAGGSDDSAIGNVLLTVFLVAFAVGPILLTVGLRRAKMVPVWVPVVAIIMTVANFVGGVPAGVVQLVALVATFAPIVVAILRQRSSAAGRLRPARSAARASAS